VHYFLEDLEKARIDVDTSIRLNADNGQAHRMLARILIRNGRLDEAQRALDTSARFLPNDATVVLQRGLLAMARRDFAAAQRELTRSLEINDAFAEAYSARGQALEGQGLMAAALADYRAAETKLAIDPDGRRAKALARERLAALTGAAQRAPAGGGPSGPQQGAVSSPSQPSSRVAQRGEDAGPSGQSAEAGPSGDRKAGEGSLYCRLVEGVFVHSRRYTGVEFDVGCRAGN
jgi:tetratricopeptide (TPR) repeat protein